MYDPSAPDDGNNPKDPGCNGHTTNISTTNNAIRSKSPNTKVMLSLVKDNNNYYCNNTDNNKENIQSMNPNNSKTTRRRRTGIEDKGERILLLQYKEKQEYERDDELLNVMDVDTNTTTTSNSNNGMVISLFLERNQNFQLRSITIKTFIIIGTIIFFSIHFYLYHQLNKQFTSNTIRNTIKIPTTIISTKTRLNNIVDSVGSRNKEDNDILYDSSNHKNDNNTIAIATTNLIAATVDTNTTSSTLASGSTSKKSPATNASSSFQTSDRSTTANTNKTFKIQMGDNPNNSSNGTSLSPQQKILPLPLLSPPPKTNRILSPLRYPIDYEMYTIRINTWKRVEILKLSIEHHVQCSGVAQIQIIWCNEQGDPPNDLLQLIEQINNDSHNNKNHNFKRVIIERHSINSLNERFRILSNDNDTGNTTSPFLSTPPTKGIFSIDDDVLRPCDAIDTGFFKWTQNYNRMVGFDARVHEIKLQSTSDSYSTNYSYGYLSTMRKMNKYSISLTRYAFLHVDYLNWYIQDLGNNDKHNTNKQQLQEQQQRRELSSYDSNNTYKSNTPQFTSILGVIDHYFNCEDIAMSFFISYHTNGLPPLLADYWAVDWSMIKLYSDNGAISSTKQHKHVRDYCVEQFLLQFRLVPEQSTTTIIKEEMQQQQNQNEPKEKYYPLRFSKFMYNKEHGKHNSNLPSWFDCGDVTHPSYYVSLLNMSHTNDSSLKSQSLLPSLTMTKTNNATTTTNTTTMAGDGSIVYKSQRQMDFIQKLERWYELNITDMKYEIGIMKKIIAYKPYTQGLIEKTAPWEKRFKNKNTIK